MEETQNNSQAAPESGKEQKEQPAATAGEQAKADPADVEKNKAMAIVAYFLFFVPLLAAKDSKFAMYHANQGLVLLLASIVVGIAGSVIPVIGWFLIGPVGSIAVLVLWIIGLLNAIKGEMKPVPLIGSIKIL